MEGVYLDDCPDIETWIASQQEAWRLDVLQLLEKLTAHHQQTADFATAVPIVRQMLHIACPLG